MRFISLFFFGIITAGLSATITYQESRGTKSVSYAVQLLNLSANIYDLRGCKIFSLHDAHAFKGIYIASDTRNGALRKAALMGK